MAVKHRKVIAQGTQCQVEPKIQIFVFFVKIFQVCAQYLLPFHLQYNRRFDKQTGRVA